MTLNNGWLWWRFNGKMVQNWISPVAEKKRWGDRVWNFLSKISSRRTGTEFYDLSHLCRNSHVTWLSVNLCGKKRGSGIKWPCKWSNVRFHFKSLIIGKAWRLFGCCSQRRGSSSLPWPDSHFYSLTLCQRLPFLSYFRFTHNKYVIYLMLLYNDKKVPPNLFIC